MKRAKRKIFVLAVAMVLSSILAALTYSVLMETTGPVRNFFEAANVTTFTVNYDLNGAEGSVSSQSHTDVTELTEYDFEVKGLPDGFTREGYTFLGWAEDSDAATATWQPGDTLTVSSGSPTRILYAVWLADRVFTLTYDYNYSGAPAPVTVTQSESGLTATSVFNVTGTPERMYYIFDGWVDSETGTAVGATVEVTYDAVTGTASKTLLASWRVDTGYKEYMISYDSNLPEDVPAEAATAPGNQQAKVKADSHTFTAAAAPAVTDAEGYGLVFEGWALTPQGAVAYAAGADVTLDASGVSAASQPLYAVWSRRYYVNFISTAGDPAAVKYSLATGQPVTDGTGISLITGDTELSVLGSYETTGYCYKRSGYVLVGFALTDDTRTPLESITLTAAGRNNAVNLYAIWTEGSYALIYDAAGGTGAPAAQIHNEAVTSVTFPILSGDTLQPSEGAYDAEFLGWAFSADAAQPDFVYDSTTGTFSPEEITLTEAEPVKTLHAVWKYHYVLSFHKGYSEDDTAVPETVDAYSTAKSFTFDMPASPQPTRANYAFQGFWSDTMDRQDGENRYYMPAADLPSSYAVTVTLDHSQTHKTVYARYLPMNGYTLAFNGNGHTGGTVPATINDMYNTSWRCTFTIPSGQKPSRTGYTFVGWATTTTATYEWLYDNDDSTQIYGGYSDVNEFVINGDVSNTQTLYAIWAPDITVQVRVNGNGGSGSYRYSTSSTSGIGCNATTTYKWNDGTYTPDRVYLSKTVTFEDYRQTSQFSMGNAGGTNGDNSSSHNALYIMTKSNAVFLGFDANKHNASPAYTVGNNVTVKEGGFKSTSANPAGQYESVGTYTIQDITVDINDPNVTKSGNTYTLTLYAVWRSTLDTYRIIAKDTPESTGTQLASATTTIGSDGKSNIVFAASDIKQSPYSRYGYVCDFTYTYGSDRTDYTVRDKWNGVTTTRSHSTKYNEIEGTVWLPKAAPVQTWYIDSDVPLNSDMKDTGQLVLSQDTSSENIAFVYTLNLYPVWKQGQLFRLTLNSSSQSNCNLYRLSFTKGSGLSEGTFSYNRVESDSITATARPEADHYTWPAGSAGEFYGHRRTSQYQMLGYAKTPNGNPVYSVKETSTSWRHNHFSILVENYSTATQYWDNIAEEMTITKAEAAESSENGIPLYTMNLYSCWRVWKTYNINFNANGGSGGTTSWTKSQVASTEPHCQFSANYSTLNTPSRTGHKFLGYAYTKARADAGQVDVTVSNGALGAPVDVVDANASDTQNWTISTNTSSAPQTITMTLYAVWELQQEFRVHINYNNATDTTSASTTTLMVMKELSEDEADLTSNGGSATLTGFKLAGFSYEPVTPGEPTEGKIDILPNESGTYTFHVGKDDKLTPNTVTTEEDGADITTMTVYAVWIENATYFVMDIDPNGGTGTTNQTIRNAVTGIVNSHSFATGQSITTRRTGYRLAGLAYADDPTDTIICTIDDSNGKTVGTLLVEEGGRCVDMNTAGNGLVTYTVRLKAVWVKQTYFKIVLDPNDGRIMDTNGSYSYDIRNLSTSWNFDYTQTAVDLTNGYFLTYSASNPVIRNSQKFLGFAFDQNAETADFTLSSSQNTSTRYLQYLVNSASAKTVSIDLNALPANSNVTSVTDETTGVTTYTITLYAIWDQQQYFKVRFDPAGGTFSGSGGVHVSSSGQRDDADPYYTFSSTSFTDTKDIYNIRPGYVLLGFSYTDWRVNNEHPTIDFPISTSSNGKAVSISNAVVYRNAANGENDGKTVETTYATEDSEQIATTTLTLYAVWGTRLSYSSKSGTTNLPATETRYEPDATNNRDFAIAQMTPVYQNFTFMGWSTTDGGILEYGAEGYYPSVENRVLKNTFTFDGTTGNQVLYAVWAYRYDLYYDLNATDASNCPQNEFVYSSAAERSIPVSSVIPQRAGYTFLGWAGSADATAPEYHADTSLSYLTSVSFTGSSDGSPVSKTLFAVWQEDTAASSDELMDPPSDDPTDSPSDESTEPPSDESMEPASDESTEPPFDESMEPPSDESMEPASDEPTDPASDEPTDPASEEPTDPASDEPTDPASEEPTDPASDEPTDPTSDEPTDPPSDDPGEPSQGGGDE